MTGNWSQTCSECRNVVDGPHLTVLTQGELTDSNICVWAATPEPLGHGGGGAVAAARVGDSSPMDSHAWSSQRDVRGDTFSVLT